jgi:hypothetical protein
MFENSKLQCSHNTLTILKQDLHMKFATKNKTQTTSLNVNCYILYFTTHEKLQE